MRNLLGRLHARRLPELLRIAEAWGVPLPGESKGEVVGTLYRAMTDPRTMRDIWERLDPAERAMVLAMADTPDAAEAPTIADIGARLGVAETEARETALRLYRAGILAREGDDDPLPIGMLPRVLLPREIALHVRRLQDEMAAGDLTRTPLRILLELLDDAELESAARIWGLRTLPGDMRRVDLTSRLLRLVNDQTRIDRVVRSRGRDAVAIWRVVRDVEEPIALSDAAAKAGLGTSDAATGARLRAALAELEGALLVWHAYEGGQARSLFVPAEIRTPGEAPAAEVPPLIPVQGDPHEVTRWRHPDALAWDLLTLLRVVADRQAPVWEVADTVPRWLGRSVNQRLWFRGGDGPPTGYLETLQAFALAEGLLAVDDDSRPSRMVLGPNLRAWRSTSFREQTARLRERWLRLPRWIEGEPAGLIDVWGADWRGMRPRLMAALADPEIGLVAGEWVTMETLAARLAARYPRLLGPSFSAATARMAGEVGAGVDEQEARNAALSDVIALELGGPFVWFGLTETADMPAHPRAVRLTQTGAALAARQEPPADEATGDAPAPLRIDSSGEIALLSPSPERVWALSAFAEQADLGRETHYRLTPGSVAAALASGIERDQITAFLERASRRPLSPTLAGNMERWARAQRRVRMRRALVLSIDDPTECSALLQLLGEGGWDAEPLGDRSVLVSMPARPGPDAAGADPHEARLIEVLRAANLAPRWSAALAEETRIESSLHPSEGHPPLPVPD
jgi:hypothetical protein